MNDSNSLPTHSIWQGLLDGDPGPAVAFFDSLMEADLSFAAGGLVQDIAERVGDADQYVANETQRSQFVEAARQVVRHCLQGDSAAIEEMMAKDLDEEE